MLGLTCSRPASERCCIMQRTRLGHSQAAVVQPSVLFGRRQIGDRPRTRSTPVKRVFIRRTAPCAVHCNTSAWLARLSESARGADSRLRNKPVVLEPSSLTPKQPPTSSAEQSHTVQTLQALQYMLAESSGCRNALVEAHLVADLLQLALGRAVSRVRVSGHLETTRLSSVEQEHVSELALDVLSMLLMCNGSPDSKVIEQVRQQTDSTCQATWQSESMPRGAHIGSLNTPCAASSGVELVRHCITQCSHQMSSVVKCNSTKFHGICMLALNASSMGQYP